VGNGVYFVCVKQHSFKRHAYLDINKLHITLDQRLVPGDLCRKA